MEDLVDMVVTVPGGADIAGGMTIEDWKTIGDMIGAAVLPPKERPTRWTPWPCSSQPPTAEAPC